MSRGVLGAVCYSIMCALCVTTCVLRFLQLGDQTCNKEKTLVEEIYFFKCAPIAYMCSWMLVV